MPGYLCVLLVLLGVAATFVVGRAVQRRGGGRSVLDALVEAIAHLF